jgi:hypothetical protein
MFTAIKSALHDMVTEPDGVSHCPVRWLALLGTGQGLGMQAWAVFVQHAAFDLQTFGIGMGAMLAAVGAALGIKKDSPVVKTDV